MAGRALLLLAAGFAAACGGRGDGDRAAYRPRTREVTVTAVPLLSKELRATYPFLEKDFAPGGVLAGKEVYAFVPSTITAIEGDTLRLHLVNPEDDAHTFVLPGLSVSIASQGVTDTVYVARRAGIYPFVCSLPAHLPYMWGQLVVLPAAGMGGGEAR
jgi:plastocyanin